nr:hypothetical protein [Tanacetum cinerariifolium]
MRRIGKGFSRVDTPLFDGMLVPQQAQNVKDASEDVNDDTEVSFEPTPPSPTLAITPPPPQQELIPSPPQTASTPLPSPYQAQTAQPSSPPLQQPSQLDDLSQSAMTFLNKLLETWGKGINELDADKDVTLVDVEEEMDATVQGRLPESQAKVYHLDLEHAETVLKVVTTVATTITAAQVPKASNPRKRRGVIIQDPKETGTASVIMHSEVKSKDKGKGIIVEEPKPLKRQAQIE